MDLRAACPNLAKCPATLSCTGWRQLAPALELAQVTPGFWPTKKRGIWVEVSQAWGFYEHQHAENHGSWDLPPGPDEFHHEIHDGSLGSAIWWNFDGNFTNDGNRMGCIAIWKKGKAHNKPTIWGWWLQMNTTHWWWSVGRLHGIGFPTEAMAFSMKRGATAAKIGNPSRWGFPSYLYWFITPMN